jgi:hypothetical protein
MSERFEEGLEDPGEFLGPSPWSDDEAEAGPRVGLSVSRSMHLYMYSGLIYTKGL